MTELFTIIHQALDHLYIKDSYLVDQRVHERSIVFRFGLYFYSLLMDSKQYSKFDLDFDYNRNMEDAKRTKVHPKGIYPDLILHKRGNNESNILALEFKPYWNPDNSDDVDKLKELTSPDQQYRFHLAISIILGQRRNQCTFTYFKKGRVVSEDIACIEEAQI